VSSTPGKVKPSGVAFLIPLVLWIIISIIAVGVMISGAAVADTTVENFARVEPGTSAVVNLKSDGGYRIFAEGPGVDGSISDPILTVDIKGPDGQTVATESYIGELSYSNSGKEGTAVQTFDVPRAGDYTISWSQSPTSTSSTPTATGIAIGKANPLSEAGKRIGLGIALGTLGFILAVIIAIVLLVKRSGSKKRQRNAGFGGPPGGGYGGPPPGGGYGGPPPGGGYGGPPPGGGGYGAPPPPPGGGGFGAPPPPPSGQSWGAPPPPPGS